jgi:hypothetical protein
MYISRIEVFITQKTIPENIFVKHNKLTPWSRVLLEKANSCSVSQEIPCLVYVLQYCDV